jgi:hypothetical protein
MFRAMKSTYNPIRTTSLSLGPLPFMQTKSKQPHLTEQHEQCGLSTRLRGVVERTDEEAERHHRQEEEEQEEQYNEEVGMIEEAVSTEERAQERVQEANNDTLTI